MLDDETAAVALLMTDGIGQSKANRAVRVAHQMARPLDELLTMSAKKRLALLPPGLEEIDDALTRCGDAERRHAEMVVGRVREAGIQVLLVTRSDYPRLLSLRLKYSAPPVLFVAGNSELLGEASAAIVGARHAMERFFAMSTSPSLAGVTRRSRKPSFSPVSGQRCTCCTVVTN